MSKHKSKILTLTLATLLSIGSVANLAYAHGYIENSRAELARDRVNVNAGPVMYEPQSVEGPGGFPASGPADGQIAGGGKFSTLDEQTEDRWVKVPLNGGKNTFTWTLTAPHRTSEWKYYITKKGWNPNQPLKRSDLEEIAQIDGNGLVPSSTVTHVIDVPTDRSGYYIVLGVWEIADTTNAFYQVMDVDLKNDGVDNGGDNGGDDTDTISPSTPSNISVTNTSPSNISIDWSASTDNVGVHHYDIYRDNKKVDTVLDTSYTDTNLTPDTSYSYTIKAVDNSGNESNFSTKLTAKTLGEPVNDTEAPTGPANVHSMGETSTSIDLHWNISTDNVAVKNYNIYRNGKLIKTQQSNRYMDTNLVTNTSYTYEVEAIDTSGNKSPKSKSFTIKTKSVDKPDNGDNNGGNHGSTNWNSHKTYVAGDTVLYNGVEYTAKWWIRGNRPDESEAWKASADAMVTWNPRGTYTGGTKVMYKGKTYSAKWWTRGDRPDTSDVWTIVK